MSDQTQTQKSAAEKQRLVHTRHNARAAMRALGLYAARDVVQWNLTDMEAHARAVLSAVEFFRASNVK